MLEAIAHAFVVIADPMTLLLLVVGVVVGVVLGVTPGVGAAIGVTLIMPLLWALEPATGVMLLIAVHSSVMTAGSIPAILLRVPGSILAVATMQDGYPMTEKGQGARAMGASLTSSAIGGLLSVPLALMMLKAIKPIVLALTSVELALLCILGLSFLAMIGDPQHRTKNLMAGLIGIIISMVGVQAATGTYRYNFGSVYLANGFDLVTVALGIFAMGEIFDLFIKGKTRVAFTKVAVKFGDVMQGGLDVFRHWWLWLRCSVIGYIIGVIPGVGGELGIFVAYGYGQKSSKHPEKWGTGIVEGVIAPESANNATVGGAMLTTMAFGIPGEAIMALILGAFLIYGIVPGEAMLTTQLPLTVTLLIGLAVANVVAVILCLPFLSRLARLAFIDSKYHFSVLTAFVMAAAFANSMILMDVIAIVPLGLLGLALKRFNYSLPCFILGFVLGALFEKYFWLSLKLQGPFFFVSTSYAIGFTVIIIAVFGWGLLVPFIKKSV